jgi:serine/threonine-protein kinase HipA
MTSSPPKEVYVWIWLPDAVQPVIAGRLASEGKKFVFNYGRSYLDRKNAIPIHKAELPLQQGEQEPMSGLTMAGCIRDGAPDAWGRRVILNHLFGVKGEQADTAQINELTYLLQSGSDRIGALDFQASPDQYMPRMATNASLDELQSAAERVEKGIPLTPELDRALHHGSSIGGARPKALIIDGSKKYIAKFAASKDVYGVVKAEFVAMRLAALAGLDVAPVKLVRSAPKDVLLVERFDRKKKGKDQWHRHALVSALTLLKLDEMMARYASYEDLAQIVRYEFATPKPALHELFGRLVFNVLCGNTDDHARNHAALWDGKSLSLSPAYDICPQIRSGGEATQAMAILGRDRASRLATCLDAAKSFLVPRAEALSLCEGLIRSIGEHWKTVCDDAALGATDRQLMARGAFLNRYAFEGLRGDDARLEKLGDQVRQTL